jgi:hypothetical protein
MESRLGQDAVRSYQRSMRIRGRAAVVALVGSLVTIAAARFVSEAASRTVGSIVVSTIVIMGAASYASMRRAIQLVLKRYGLPPAYSSTVLGRTLREERAFDEWLAESRLTILNRNTSPTDDPRA